MPDSSDIDAALIAKLQGDATLAALAAAAPPAAFVFWDDEAPAGVTKFISVSLVDEEDGTIFEGTAHEDTLYLVKWVELSNTVKNAKAAAARIQALLHLGTLTIAGYSLMVMRRRSRIRMAEPFGTDSALDWYHRGGRYQVMVAPIGT